MAIGLGLGMATYTFSTAKGYWRWVKRCDEAGVDSLWQTDRLVSKEPFFRMLDSNGRSGWCHDENKIWDERRFPRP